MELHFVEPSAGADAAASDDAQFRDAYMAALIDRIDAGEIFTDDDEDAGWAPPVDEDAPPVFVRGVEEAEGVIRRSRILAFETDRQFREVLDAAETHPDPWVGPDPYENDPGYEDPRGWSPSAVRARRRRTARRAATWDLACRSALSEHQVNTRAWRAEILATRAPKLWAKCLNGQVPEQNAAIAVTHLTDMPASCPESWATYDDLVHEWATMISPRRFATTARRARDKAHPVSRKDRHAQAAAEHTVTFREHDDGVGSLYAVLPVVTLRQVQAVVENEARILHDQPDETRTLGQLRAAALGDRLLTGMGGGAAGAALTPASAPASAPASSPPVHVCPKVKATIYLTIPALTLLGQSTDPPILHGYGPIPVDEARALAAGNSDWIRVLTHPLTSTPLDLERRTYRVPTSLRRWLGYLHHTCVGPGCTRPAHECDIDHQKQWSAGGNTAASNTEPLCASEHTVKDETLWDYQIDPATGTVTWTSPTGLTHAVPPDAPF